MVNFGLLPIMTQLVFQQGKYPLAIRLHHRATIMGVLYPENGKQVAERLDRNRFGQYHFL